MKRSDTLALIAYYIAAVRQKEAFSKAQEAVWIELMDDTDPRDARSALDKMLASGMFVTPQAIVEEAIGTRFTRLETENANRSALPPERDDRPPCCIEAEGSFRHWLEKHASPDEVELAKKHGVAKLMEGAS